MGITPYATAIAVVLVAVLAQLKIVPHGIQPTHSARSASTGSRRAARMAGTTPAANPINIDTTSAPRA
jgi:hypothetical protein